MRVLRIGQLSEESAFDDNLLLIGLLGILFFNMFLIAPALAAAEGNEVARIVFTSEAILDILQALMQVYFYYLVVKILLFKVERIVLRKYLLKNAALLLYLVNLKAFKVLRNN